MTAKTSPARRAAFFAALTATGNQTLAAERAKVSRSWVSLHRASDPAFRQAMGAAVAAARERLTQADAVGPDAGWRTQAGEELLVRGSNGRRAQVARARMRQWTPRVEARFLAALARSCNVKLACAATGLSVASAYNHRGRWEAFAERWDAALAEGYDALETALVRAAAAMLGDAYDDDCEGEPAIRMTSIDEALQLLRLHRHRVHGVGSAPGRWRRPRTLDEMRPSILKKLEQFMRVNRLDGPGRRSAKS